MALTIKPGGGTEAVKVLSGHRCYCNQGRETWRCMPPTCLTFAAFGSKPKVVDLTALTVLTGDARLALTLAGADVTLPIGGTQSMAVAPGNEHRTLLR